MLKVTGESICTSLDDPASSSSNRFSSSSLRDFVELEQTIKVTGKEVILVCGKRLIDGCVL